MLSTNTNLRKHLIAPALASALLVAPATATATFAAETPTVSPSNSAATTEMKDIYTPVLAYTTSAFGYLLPAGKPVHIPAPTNSDGTPLPQGTTVTIVPLLETGLLDYEVYADNSYQLTTSPYLVQDGESFESNPVGAELLQFTITYPDESSTKLEVPVIGTYGPTIFSTPEPTDTATAEPTNTAATTPSAEPSAQPSSETQPTDVPAPVQEPTATETTNVEPSPTASAQTTESAVAPTPSEASTEASAEANESPSSPTATAEATTSALANADALTNSPAVLPNQGDQVLYSDQTVADLPAEQTSQATATQELAYTGFSSTQLLLIGLLSVATGGIIFSALQVKTRN